MMNQLAAGASLLIGALALSPAFASHPAGDPAGDPADADAEDDKECDCKDADQKDCTDHGHADDGGDEPGHDCDKDKDEN